MNLKEAFKKLSSKIFGQEIDIPNEFMRFINLLELCRNFKGITGENKLLLTLFELIFLEKGAPKSHNDTDLLDCFKLCLESKLEDAKLESYVKAEEKLLSDSLFNEKIFSKNDLRLIAFIVKVKKDFNLFFKSFEDIYMEKCEKYIPSKHMEIIFSEKTFEDNLYDFSLLYNMLIINPKNYFSIIVDQKHWFITETKTAEEIKEYKNKNKKINLNILLNLINNNKPNPKTKVSSNNNKITNVRDFKEHEEEKEKSNENDLAKKIEMLEEEIRGIKIRESKANNTHRETLNGLKKEIIEMKQNYELKEKENENKMLILLKKQEEKISSNNNKIEQLKMANKIMEKKLKKLENEKDTIKACGISKSIINFIAYAFGENINQKFSDKVSFIQKYIEKKNEKNKSLLLEELKQLVNEIEILEYNGDIFAHSDINWNLFSIY